MAHDVFISHAEEDKQVAAEVCRALEEQGVKCWIAPRDVRLGADYEKSILKAVSESSLLVLIFSSYANGSPHVEREVRRAFKKGSQKEVVPFRLEDIPYNDTLDYYLDGPQWLDAWAQPLQDGIRLLVKHVRSRLDEVKAAEDAADGGIAVEEAAASGAAEPDDAARPLVTDVGDARVSKEETEEATEDEHTLRGADDWRKKIPLTWLAAGALALSLLAALAIVYWPGGGGARPVIDPNGSNSNGSNSNLVANGNANVAPPLTPTPAANVAATPTPTATRPATRPTPTQTMTPQPPADSNTPPQPGGAGEGAGVALDARRAQAIMANLSQHSGLSRVSVAVKGGMATLSGQVYSSSCRLAAEAVVSQSGFRLRANNIRVVKAPINTPREQVSCAAGQ